MTTATVNSKTQTSNTMKAIIAVGQGAPDKLQHQTVAKPMPRANEVLIRVHASTVTAGDTVMRKMPRLAYLFLGVLGLKRKTTPGHELAGVVEAVGAEVTRFKVGDGVYGTTTGLPVGSNAEYIVLPETWKSGVISHKPVRLTHTQAAAMPVGAMTALYILRKANIQAGQAVLIYGASGSVGSYAVQIAKAWGAHVTAVASGRNADMLAELGADAVLDYTQDDFMAQLGVYDVVFDAVGKTRKKIMADHISEGGHYLSVRGGVAKESVEALDTLAQMADQGKITPFIDRTFALADVAEAHTYVDSGRKRGNVVIESGASS
jgi:NADPH:quinone reductase-like Zn-dependent oxidoreductase